MIRHLQGYTGDVVLVSHDRDEVCRMCRQVCVLTRGRSEPQRPVRELMASPDTVGAARLSGCKNVSAARRIDDRTVFCPGWGLTLETAAPVPDTLTAAGIRAHHIVPGTAECNSAVCRVAQVRRNAFSVLVTLLPESGDGETLTMELSPGEWVAQGGAETLTVHVLPERVIPLTGGGV